MRAMSDDALEALSGSRIGEGVTVHVWYDGVPVAENLDISRWSVSSDGTRQVQTQVSLDVVDAEGALAPWGVDDPLGVGGSQVQVIYTMTGGETVDLGWFRITSSDPTENWTLRKIGSGITEVDRWVPGGALIPIQANDLAEMIVADKLLAPESPIPGATVLGEVRRLVGDIVPVHVAQGLTDKNVPTSVVYERERLDAVEDLLKTIGAAWRMTGDGQFEVFPRATGAPVWTVEGGDEGVLITVRRSQSVDGMYNAVASEGATDDGVPLVGRAFEEAGPLRWDGPHGHRPLFHSATGLLKTQAAVDADARTRLRTEVSSRTMLLPVTCLPHPGLQPGDVVTVASPSVTGAAIPLDGVVRTINLSGSTSGVSPMTMTVECSYADVQTVAAAIRRST